MESLLIVPSESNILRLFELNGSLPNKYGSKYYDIYSFDVETVKEERLTIDARAFNPVFIQKDSSIAYIATYDGGQDIYKLDLKSKNSEKLTDFKERPMISHLNYEARSKQLIFDITKHHYRDIYSYDLVNETIDLIENNSSFDERNMSENLSGLRVYSKDKSGIFNLYMSNSADTSAGYITNVTGGAFMPDVSKNGKVLYSVYDKGSYNIALLDKIFYIEDDFVGYGEDYNSNNELNPPIVELNNSKSKPVKF